MANITKVMTVISKEFKRRYAKACPLFDCVNRQYDKRYEAFGAAAGESIQIKVPQQTLVYETQSMVSQANEEKTETLSNTKWSGAALAFSASELTDDLMEPNNLKLFADDYLQSAVDSISANVHSRMSTFMFANTYNNLGSPGTSIANHQLVTQAGARLSQYSCPTSDRSIVLNPDEMASLNYGMSGLFNSQTNISKQLIDGFVSRTSNFDFYQSPHLTSLTTGTRTNTTPLVDGTVTSGTSIVVKGAGTSPTFVVGDKFTVAGCKAVNPLTKAVLPFLQQFVVTTAVTASSGGAVTLTVFPEIITSGQYQNVSSTGVVDGKALTFAGTASTSYVQGIAMHKDAFVFATQRIANIGAPQESTFMEDGITFKLTLGSDINNMTSISRIDMKWGIGRLIPSRACILWGGSVPA